MRRSRVPFLHVLAAATVSSVLLAVGPPARAHCDTLDGPVVVDARSALATGDVTPVLKWVAPDLADSIRAAFARSVAVAKLGPEAKALAETWFLETLVRVHREGEGAPYTGLKPAGSVHDPAVLAADAALESGSVDSLVSLVTREVASGLRERFERTAERKKRAAESVEAGREFVAAYVDFVHYAERVHGDAAANMGCGHAP